jgi:hypothetical protein
MTGEIPQPERDRGPEVRLFNVDALSDDELIVLARSFREAADHEDESEPFSQTATYDNLLDRLALDVRDLATRDPERVKGLMSRCRESNVGGDQDLAVNTVSVLVHYDYEFTRDMLVSFLAGPDAHTEEDIRLMATSAIRKLMRYELTSEQSDDFNVQLVRFSYTHEPLEPARPDER